MEKTIVKLGRKRAVSYLVDLQLAFYNFFKVKADVYDDLKKHFDTSSKYVADELDIAEDKAFEMLANGEIEFMVEMGYVKKKERERQEADKERKAQKKMAEFEAMPYI